MVRSPSLPHSAAHTKANVPNQPPKRKTPASSRPATSTPKPRQSKLAKEHNITAEEENEIREAFSLFSEQLQGEKEGVIPTSDVRRCLIALGIPPSSQAELSEFLSILDPEEEGFVTYPNFVAIAALKMHAREDDEDGKRGEVDDAFGLFVGGSEGREERITLGHLKRVAALLKEEVDEAVLKDMILEANGGAGVGKGVGREEFEGVMRRAGVWR
jgi:hydroxyacylglutathione hydrolase